MSVSNAMRPRRLDPGSSAPTLLILGAILIMGIAATLLSLQFQQWTIMVFIIAIVLLLRRYEIAAGMLIVAEVLLDWSELLGAPLYWPLISLVCAVILLTVLFLTQSKDRPWVETPYLGLWAVILVLGLYPAVRGLDHAQSIQYYLNIFLGSAMMYIIGVQVSTDRKRWQRLLGVLSAFGALIGLHSIIITWTGVFLFEPEALQRYLITVANYTLANSTIHRAGSFLTNPDSNGAFLAMLLVLTIGLAWSAQSWAARLLYIAELALIAGGLICTFSIGSLLGLAPSLFVFILFVTKTMKQRLLTVGGVLLAAAGALIAKPSLLRTFLQHGSATGEIALRLGAWETGIRVILTHPLTGVGLGYSSYITRAEPYRVALQYRPLSHPHDAFLELGAMAGIPLMLAFITLLFLAFRQGIRFWRSADSSMRIVVAGVLCSLLTLTFNSFTANAWTLPPLAMMGWLLIGAMTSPALVAKEAPAAAHTARPLLRGWLLSMRNLAR